MTPSHQALAGSRRVLLSRALPYFEQGLSQLATAQLCGCPHTSLCKLLALAPIHKSERVGPAERCRRLLGAPLEALAPREPARPGSEFAVLLQVPALVEELRALYLSVLRASSEGMTDGRHTGSMSLALKRLADHPLVPEPLAVRLRRGARPAGLLRHIRSITPELEQLIRGERHYRNHGPTAQRDDTLRLPDGSRARQLAGFRVVLDDMSVNQPFYTDIKEDGQVVDTILSRQGLYAMDESSRRWLGVELVARPREAYRAEDILRFVHRLVTLFGKFDHLVLEQGIWRARIIAGFTQATNGELLEYRLERPAMSEQEQADLTQGLSAIGIHVVYVSAPHDKIIENGFGFLQPVIATFTRDFQNIGAHAGEFERAARELRRARAETIHPSQARFAPMDPLADRIEQAMTWCNTQPKECLGGRTPDQQWDLDLMLRKLPEIQPWERAVFMPNIRERTLAGGAVHFGRGVLDFPFSFRAGEDFAELGDGYRVTVRFDACDPAQGAAILNREPAGSSRNLRQLAYGQFLCWAPFELPAPRMDVSELPVGHVAEADYYGLGIVDPRDTELRRQKKWHRTAARLLPRPGQPAVRAGVVRDGRGNVAEVADGSQGRFSRHLETRPSKLAPLVTLVRDRDPDAERIAFACRTADDADLTPVERIDGLRTPNLPPEETEYL